MVGDTYGGITAKRYGESESGEGKRAAVMIPAEGEVAGEEGAGM